MAYIDDERYSRVNPERMLDVADELEATVKKMRRALVRMGRATHNAKLACASQGLADDTWWSGEAHDLWASEYESAYERLMENLYKYDEFPRYIRTYAEIYLKAAVNAEQTGKEVGKNVRQLLADILAACDIAPGSGTTTIKDIRAAAKVRPVLLQGVHYDLPLDEEDE